LKLSEQDKQEYSNETKKISLSQLEEMIKMYDVEINFESNDLGAIQSGDIS